MTSQMHGLAHFGHQSLAREIPIRIPWSAGLHELDRLILNLKTEDNYNEIITVIDKPRNCLGQ